MDRNFFSGYTGLIVLANVLVFITYLFWAYFYSDPIYYLALQPAMILQGKYLWTFITSMFMHAGLAHLAFNMISLIFLGGFVERLIGKKRFLWLYFVGGIIASLFFVFFAGFFGTSAFGAKAFGSPTSLAVGASGAIFALIGLLTVLTPKMKVLAFFVIPMPMWFAMVLFTFVIWSISLSMPLHIGNTAHLGGLVVGLAYGVYLRVKYPKKTKMISRYFSS